MACGSCGELRQHAWELEVWHDESYMWEHTHRLFSLCERAPQRSGVATLERRAGSTLYITKYTRCIHLSGSTMYMCGMYMHMHM